MKKRKRLRRAERRTSNIEHRTSKAKAEKAAAPPVCEKSQTQRKMPARSGLSARQEKFCRLYAAGTTATEAYREAYGNTKTAEAASSRLLTSVKVKARVEALQKEAAAAAVLTLKEKREFLRRVVTTPIGEVNETSALCQAAEYGDTSRKYKMPCKLRAIELDAKLAGELREQPEVSIEAGGDVFVVTPARLAELQKRRAEALRKK